MIPHDLNLFAYAITNKKIFIQNVTHKRNSAKSQQLKTTHFTVAKILNKDLLKSRTFLVYFESISDEADGSEGQLAVALIDNKC